MNSSPAPECPSSRGGRVTFLGMPQEGSVAMHEWSCVSQERLVAWATSRLVTVVVPAWGPSYVQPVASLHNGSEELAWPLVSVSNCRLSVLAVWVVAHWGSGG